MSPINLLTVSNISSWWPNSAYSYAAAQWTIEVSAQWLSNTSVSTWLLAGLLFFTIAMLYLLIAVVMYRVIPNRVRRMPFRTYILTSMLIACNLAFIAVVAGRGAFGCLSLPTIPFTVVAIFYLLSLIAGITILVS